MALLASRSLWEQTTSDVIVDLVGVSSNHGVGIITVEGADVVVPPQEEHGTVGLIWPSRGRRPRRIVGPGPLPDVIVRLDGISSNHGVGESAIDVDLGAKVPGREGIGSLIIDVSAEMLIPRRRFVPRASIDVAFPINAPVTRRGGGQVSVDTPFDITDDEMMVLLILSAA